MELDSRLMSALGQRQWLNWEGDHALICKDHSLMREESNDYSGKENTQWTVTEINAELGRRSLTELRKAAISELDKSFASWEGLTLWSSKEISLPNREDNYSKNLQGDHNPNWVIDHWLSLEGKHLLGKGSLTELIRWLLTELECVRLSEIGVWSLIKLGERLLSEFQRTPIVGLWMRHGLIELGRKYLTW